MVLEKDWEKILRVTQQQNKYYVYKFKEDTKNEHSIVVHLSCEAQNKQLTEKINKLAREHLIAEYARANPSQVQADSIKVIQVMPLTSEVLYQFKLWDLLDHEN